MWRHPPANLQQAEPGWHAGAPLQERFPPRPTAIPAVVRGLNPMHYSACDHCNRLFVVRHRPSPLRPCPRCRRGLRVADREEADRFWDRFTNGDIEGTPIFTLREAILRDLASPHRMSTEHRSALAIKAWNAMRQGKSPKILSWRPGAGEKYPEIE